MRRFMTLALTLGLVLTLGLTSCGRKGALQPPPAADAPVEEPRRVF